MLYTSVDVLYSDSSVQHTLDIYVYTLDAHRQFTLYRTEVNEFQLFTHLNIEQISALSLSLSRPLSVFFVYEMNFVFIVVFPE